MRARLNLDGLRRHVARRIAGQQGLVVVVVMVFCLIFLILGVALYWNSIAQIRATETERKDIKSFNVAEAGVDAGMLALKLDWPFFSYDYVTVDGYELKSELQDRNSTLYDPERSDASEFLQVQVYDNSFEKEPAGSGEYETVTSPPDIDDRVMWDANDDGKMYVDATANVQDARHRILLLAQRQAWNMYFPVEVSLYSSTVDANGTGFEIDIEVGEPPIYYDVHDVEHKGINLLNEDDIVPVPSETEFAEHVDEALIRSLKRIASQRGTYFVDDAAAGVDADVAAQTFLTSGNADGAVVYIESDTPVEISSGDVIGSEDAPVVVVMEAPEGSQNVWDMGGNAELWGILVVLGNAELHGSCTFHGAVFCSGELLNKGVGFIPELLYNANVINNINRQYVLSVNIVPNTWEEYTIPETE